MRWVRAERRATNNTRICSTGPLRVFGHRSSTRNDGPGGCVRIDGIRLTSLASILAVGSIHLDGLDLLVVEEPGQPDPPRSGAFHTHQRHCTEAGQPAQQFFVTGSIGGERLDPQHRTVTIDRSCHMDISVGIHPTDHSPYHQHQPPLSLA